MMFHYQSKEHQGDCDRIWFGLHGSGRTEDDLGPIIRKVDHPAAQVLVRGGLAWDHGFAFFARRRDRMIDLESLQFNAKRIEDFVAHQQAIHGLEKKTFLIGVSNGAIMAAALILRGRLSLEGAILFRPLAPALDPHEGKAPKPPILILEGMRDERRAPADATHLTLKLRQAGFRVSQWASECGHSPAETEFCIANRWLQEVIIK